MGKTGNKGLKIAGIVAVIVVAAVMAAVLVLPSIPIRKVDENTYKLLDNNTVYERYYNIYGKQIYKNKSEALKQFKSEYGQVLSYMSEKLGIEEFNTDYDTLSKYNNKGWQYTFSEDEKKELGEEKVNEFKHKMAGISAFCDVYENTNWRYYVGLVE